MWYNSALEGPSSSWKCRVFVQELHRMFGWGLPVCCISSHILCWSWFISLSIKVRLRKVSTKIPDFLWIKTEQEVVYTQHVKGIYFWRKTKTNENNDTEMTKELHGVEINQLWHIYCGKHLSSRANKDWVRLNRTTKMKEEEKTLFTSVWWGGCIKKIHHISLMLFAVHSESDVATAICQIKWSFH